MSFDTLESSRSLGRPLNLVKFNVGTRAYCYTDSVYPITFGAETYEPVPLSRDAVTSSGTLDKTTLSIKLPVTSDVVELFRVYPPSTVVGVTVFQGHFDDEDHEFKAVWFGRVLSCSRSGLTATLGCEPFSTSMKRPGLRRRYQRGCPHVLYGDGCRLNRASFQVSSTISDVDGPYITMPAGWHGGFTASRFVGGRFDSEGETRTILQVIETTNTVLVSGAIQGAIAGDTVTLNPGCEHTIDACNQFGNILNFGGQPWIPTTNPIGNNNQFY